jgi:predicted nucleic-acid-binding Zn-ribbon protein
MVYCLTCPKCGNKEDFRKEITKVVAISSIYSLVEEGENYFEDRSDVDIYPVPGETGGVVEIYCNKCDYMLDYGSDCNDEGKLIKRFIEKGWLLAVETEND